MENFDPVKYINSPKWQESRLGLERMKKLLDMIGNPQKKLKFVHVAGTNGKGSTCAYISQILIESGYKTGQFTSPYIYEFAERIRINNVQISDNDLKEVTLQVKNAADKFDKGNHPTEFELMTAVAFTYFALQKCDVVVSEVGMGGRLDSTNVIEANETLVSVITTIDFDHMQFLGNTIAAIAAEKAAIIKPTVPVVSAVQIEDAKKEIIKKSDELGCNVTFVDQSNLIIDNVDLEVKSPIRNFNYKSENYKTKLLATYQPKNAALAIEICEIVKHSLNKIDQDSITKGINNAIWPARFEIIQRRPYIILDGGHNVSGVKVLIDSLKDLFPNKSFIFIMGVLADKEYMQMAEMIIPFAKKIFTVTPPNPRNLSAENLAECFNDLNIDALPVGISEAFDIAKNNCDADDVIVAFGSLYSIKSLSLGLS